MAGAGFSSPPLPGSWRGMRAEPTNPCHSEGSSGASLPAVPLPGPRPQQTGSHPPLLSKTCSFPQKTPFSPICLSRDRCNAPERWMNFCGWHETLPLQPTVSMKGMRLLPPWAGRGDRAEGTRPSLPPWPKPPAPRDCWGGQLHCLRVNRTSFI